jgi:hypothetical protein
VLSIASAPNHVLVVSALNPKLQKTQSVLCGKCLQHGSSDMQLARMAKHTSLCKNETSMQENAPGTPSSSCSR